MPVVDEIWRLVTAALKGGQKRFHVHVFPFRMTEENLGAAPARARGPPFWRDLKRGYDAFEATRLPPRISVCAGRYAVAPARGAAATAAMKSTTSCMDLTSSKG